MKLTGLDWRPFRAEFVYLFRSESTISFWVGEGWFQLMWNLAESLETLARHQVAMGQPPIRILQVKEKDGGICCLLDNGTEESDQLVLDAQIRSLSICEACGRPGTIVSASGWDKALCLFHEMEARHWLSG